MKLLEEYSVLKDSIKTAGFLGNMELPRTIYCFIGYGADDIPAKKVSNAKTSIGKNLSEDETLLVLWDNTLFGSATDGVIFTDKNIHSRESSAEPVVVPYETIESVSVNIANGKITLKCFDKNIVIYASGLKSPNIIQVFVYFILGMAVVIKTKQNGIVLNNDEARDLLIDALIFNVEYGIEDQKPNEFFKKYADVIADIIKKLGIKELIMRDENWELVSFKIYQLLPVPFRLIIPENKFSQLVLANKDKFLNILGITSD